MNILSKIIHILFKKDLLFKLNCILNARLFKLVDLITMKKHLSNSLFFRLIIRIW